MKIIGNNPEILKLIPEPMQKAWPGITLALDVSAGVPEGTDKKKTIGVATNLDGKGLIRAAESSGIYHIVQTSAPEFIRELNSAAMMMEKPLTFIDDPVGVILQTFEEKAPASAAAATSKTGEQAVLRRFKYNFNSSMEKKAALDSLRIYIEKVPKSRTIQNDAMVIADELFTNAVFNAPNKGHEVSRTISVHLDARKPPNVFSFFNADRLVLGVEDPYGSLGLERAIERIKGCYEKGVSPSIRMGTGGAGIGLFMVFDLSTSFYICVEEGKSTTVCATLPLGVSGRAKEGMSKNCHLQFKKK